MEALRLIRDLFGCPQDQAELLGNALGGANPKLEDIHLLKEYQLTIRACRRYQKLFGDELALAKKIIDTIGEPLDETTLRSMVSAAENSQAQMLVRLHTGEGPTRADAYVAQVREELICALEARAKKGLRVGVIRQYATILQCSLIEAKRKLDSRLRKSAGL